MKRIALALACGVAACAVTLSAAAIQSLKIADGYDDGNRIVAPIFDAGVSLELAVSGTAKSRNKFVRRTGGRLPATRGPEYDLDPKVNLAELLAEALRAEALAMGLNPSGTGERHWRVNATIKDAYLESRQVYMGATLFYGYMEVDLAVNGPGGESRTVGMRVHNYSGGYNAGIGRRDEAESSAAHLLVEGAQEILGRLNRDFFKAVRSSAVAGKLAGLQPGGLNDKLGDLRAIGLSGAPAAVPALLGMLPKEGEEKTRAAIVNSLALLGSADAIAPLAARYSLEDEDVRWYTLKALDYIGGPEARQAVTANGLKDEDAGPKRLAGRITAGAP